MSYVAIVPPLHIDDVWVKVLPHLLNGRDRWEHFYTAAQIRQSLILGMLQLWVMVDGNQVLGIVVTQLDDFPNGKSLRFLYLGGVGFKRSMMKEIHKIELWAKGKGAKLVDFMGREEWEPLLDKLGYHTQGVVYRKEL